MNRLDNLIWNLINTLAGMFPGPGSITGWRQVWLLPAVGIVYIQFADYLYTIGRRSPTLAPMFLLLILTIYYSGFWPGLTVAGLTIGAAWHFWPDDISRCLIVTGVMLATTLTTATLQRKAQILDSLDTNVMSLKKIKAELDYLLDDWDALSRKEIRGLIEEIRFQTAQLLTKAQGWLELSRRMEEIRDIMTR